MTSTPHVIALTCLLAASSCECMKSVTCDWSYEMVGDSDANAKLYDPGGNELQRIDIGASARCKAAKVTVTHRDASARLKEPPTGPCLVSSSGKDSPRVSFEYKVSCECDDPWSWYATDKAPPVKFPVRIQPVPGCAGG